VVTTAERLKASGALRSVALPVRHVRAADLAPSLGGLGDGEQTVQVGPRGQHLIVTATPDRLAQARDLVAAMDRPLPQVAIEVRVVELATDRLREVGIDLAAVRRGSTMVSGAFTPPAFAVSPAGTLELEKTTSEYTLDATLKVMERRGQARILASPRLLTLAGQPARILVGDRVPYFTTQFGIDGKSQVVVNFVEVGIRLDFVPNVQADHAITTRIRSEVSSIVSFRGPLEEIPWVKTREAETTVRVERGQWVSLGGLLSREERETVVSVPLLGDIPALGSLFRSARSERLETEVVIMVSPTLVRP
jgi:type II secretory pathway component GspD/PulD (secretin)